MSSQKHFRIFHYLLFMGLFGMLATVYGQDTWYVDMNFNQVSKPDAAAYSEPGMMDESGQRVFISTISTDTLFIAAFKNNRRHGLFQAYNQAGFLQERGVYRNGKKSGLYTYHNYEGGLFRKEYYNWRHRIKAESYIDEKGREIFTIADKDSRFNVGGSDRKAINALGRYVNDNLIVPAVADNYDSPFVMVHFIISPKGEIQDVNIENEIHPEMSQAVLKLVQEMPDWRPAIFNRNAVYSEFYLSVSF